MISPNTPAHGVRGLRKEQARILLLLESGPMTSAEVAHRAGLTVSRVNNLLTDLRERGRVISGGCTHSPKGRIINLWSLAKQAETTGQEKHPEDPLSRNERNRSTEET